MLDPSNISNLVRSTLKQFDIYDTSIERLIKLTFLMESNLECVYDEASKFNSSYGLMMMPKKQIENVLNEYTKFRPSSVRRMINVSSLDAYDPVYLMDESTWNLKLMVLITFEYYSSKYKTIPSNDIKEIVQYYMDYYDDTDEYTKDQIIDIYNSVFSG